MEMGRNVEGLGGPRSAVGLPRKKRQKPKLMPPSDICSVRHQNGKICRIYRNTPSCPVARVARHVLDNKRGRLGSSHPRQTNCLTTLVLQ